MTSVAELNKPLYKLLEDSPLKENSLTLLLLFLQHYIQTQRDLHLNLTETTAGWRYFLLRANLTLWSPPLMQQLLAIQMFPILVAHGEFGQGSEVF